MDLESECFKIFLDSLSCIRENIFVIGEQRKVIDISDVLLYAEVFLDEMIEPRQIDVGKKLTGEVADRKPASALEWSEKVISIEIHVPLILTVAVINYQIDQLECPLAF